MSHCAIRSTKALIVGPRMLVATKGIGATGGHFDPTSGFRDILFGREPNDTDGIVDGPDAIRKAVRFEVKNGADVIKAAVSGGVLSLADEVDTPQLTPAEMVALVDESHRLRKKVAVHCHGDQAAQGGNRSGSRFDRARSFMKPETLTLMKNKGTYLTSDFDGVGMDHGQDRAIIRRRCRQRRKLLTTRARKCFATP